MHAAHEPIVLALVRLQYVEADDDTVEQLRDAAADVTHVDFCNCSDKQSTLTRQWQQLTPMSQL